MIHRDQSDAVFRLAEPREYPVCHTRQVQQRRQWPPEILQTWFETPVWIQKLLLARAGNFFHPVNRCNKGVIQSSLNLVCCLIHFELILRILIANKDF